MEKRVRIVLLATVALLTGMLFGAQQHRPPSAISVHTAAAEIQDVYNSITIFGTIETAESVVVCPAENAVVCAAYVAAGDTVEQGDILCTLANVGGEQNVAAYRQAAQRAFLIADAVRTVIAEDRYVLRAPADGTVFAMPQAGESVLAGVPCVQVADPDKLRVRANAPELYAGELSVGQRAEITTPITDTACRAEISALAPAAVKTFSLTGESTEATVEVLLDLKGNAVGWKSGCSATVKVFTDRHSDAVVVPYEAVYQRGKQEYVCCVRNGYTVQCAVQTGYMLEDTVEIINGLNAGEQVILSPDEELADGTPVEVLS